MKTDSTIYPAKVKLSGADCFHLVLGKHSKKNKKGNTLVRIAFFLNENLSAETLNSFLLKSPMLYWLCNVELNKGSLISIPYWKFVDKNKNIKVKEYSHFIDHELPIDLLNNTIELNSETFIQCDLVHYKSGKSAFVLSWDHILMDGRGAGILIKHLSSVHYFNANDLHHFFPKEETKVSIYQYIKNMYKVKHFIEKSSKAPIASVTQKIENEGIPLYHTLVFEKEIVEQIEKNAVKKGARFGLNLFLIASCAHVVNKLNKKRNSVGDLWFPIPYDGRLRGAKGPIVTNNVSTLFYRFSQTDLNSIEKTIESLNKQMAEQLKMEMPKKYNMLLNMMRHIPNRLYYFLVNRSSEGSFASFLYTSTGENIQHMEHLFDKQIENVQIYPQHTYPPGLTFSFLRFNGSIRLNFAYISTSISEKELGEMKNNLNKILLD